MKKLRSKILISLLVALSIFSPSYYDTKASLISDIAEFLDFKSGQNNKLLGETSNYRKPSTFLELSDTPNSYSGASGKLVGVNSSENALEFIPPFVPYTGATANVDLGNFGIYSNITGINQIVQRNSMPIYGDSDASPLYIHGAVTVDGKLFMGSRAATPDNKIFRYNDPENNINDVDSVTLASNLDHIERMVLNTDSGKIIFCANNTTDDGTFRLFELDPSDLSYTEVFTSTTLGWTESPGFEYINGYIVGGTYGDPAKLFRIKVSDWSLEEVVTMSPSVRRVHSAGYTVYSDRTELYLTSPGGASGKFIKVNPFDLTTYQILTLPHATYTDDLAVIQVNDTYSYVYTGTELGVPDEESGVRIKTDDLSYDTFFARPTYGFFWDGTDLWNMAYTGSIQKYPGADITKPQIYDTDGHNPNEFFKIGSKMYFTDWNVTGGIYEFSATNEWLPAGGYFANALGTGATADANFSNTFGVFSHIGENAIESISMGNYNQVTDPYSAAIGYNLRSTAPNSMIIGIGTKIGVLNNPGINDEQESIYFTIPNSLTATYPLKLYSSRVDILSPTFNTGSVNVGGSIATLGQYTPWTQFDITATPQTNVEGLLQWNATDGTLDLGLLGGVSTMQIGQELPLTAYNETGVDIPDGMAVYVSGRHGHLPEISLARSDSETTSSVFGITTTNFGTTGDNKKGIVTTFGYVRQIKTNYEGEDVWGTTWAVGDKLYVSKTVPGQLTNVEPDAPHHSDVVATVAILGEQGIGSIFVSINRHKTLEELSDVNGTALTADGQIPTWDNTHQYFDFTKNINDYTPLTDTTTFLKLNQTTPQTVDSGRPIFNYGINLPTTTSSITGVITKGTSRFIHNFQHPTGNTAIPVGRNTFAGVDAGNFTMGSTATTVDQGSYNTGFGDRALQSLTTGYFNTVIGVDAGKAITSGLYNNMFGGSTGVAITTGNFNTGMGASAFNKLVSGNQNVVVAGVNGMINLVDGSYNTAVGSYAGSGAVSSNYGVYLGYFAGRYETGSNKIMIDNLDRTNEALSRSSALFYGVTNSSVLSQTVSMNARVKVGISDVLLPLQTLDVAGSINFDPVTRPVISAMTSTLAGVAGNVDNGVHYYSVSYYDGNGNEAVQETGGAVITVTDKTTNGQINLANIPISADPRVVGRKIYRSTAGGSQYVCYLLATIANNTATTYTDNTADSGLNTSLSSYRRPNITGGRIYNENTLVFDVPDQVHTAIGMGAGSSNTTGHSYVFIGGLAGLANTTGTENVFVGQTAGSANTTGSANIGIGYATLYFNKTGANNIAIGSGSLRTNSESNYSNNVAVGTNTLNGILTNSNWNTAIGYQAGLISSPTSTLVANTFIGAHSAAYTLKQGNYNFLAGYNADVPAATTSNFLNLGNSLFATNFNTNTTIGGLSTNTKWGFGKYAPESVVDIRLLSNSTVVDTPIAFQVARDGANGFLTASSGVQYFSQISPSINQSGTAGWVGLRIMASISDNGSGEQTLLQLGDNTNNTKFEADGTMVMNGTATVFEDLQIPAISLKVLGTGITENSAENTMDFATNADYPTDYIYGSFQMSHSKKLGSDVHLHIHWEQEEDNIPNWLIEYRWQNQSGEKTTAWTQLPLDTNAWSFTGTTFDQITSGIAISPSPDNLSDILQIRLYRDTANDSGKFSGNDPYSLTARVTFIDLHYEKDTIGSRQEYTK